MGGLSNEHREILDNAVLLQLQTLIQKTEREAIHDAFHLLDCVKHHVDSLGPATAQSIHAFLWSHIQSLYSSQQYDQAIQWCQVALHPSLSPPSSSAAGTFARKIIASHIELGCYTDALSFFHTLPRPAQDHLLTRFLLFRLAVRGWNQSLARECLAFFAARESRREARDALYACVREAQSAGDRLCTAEALAAAARAWKGEGVVVAANVPCLLRCAIRLLHAVVEEQQQQQQGPENAHHRALGGAMEAEMVNLFNIASELVASNVRDDEGETVFTNDELRWYSTNSYNLGVIHVTSWEPGRLVSLFKGCLVFTQAAISSDADAVDATQATITMLRCHFILASLYISEAQIIKNEHTESLYADVEHHATEFVNMLVDDCDSTAASCPDMLQKLGILCVFQFEALLFRQFFDHLPCIVKQARLSKDANVFKALGGCLIRSDAPVQVKSSLLKSIVNQIFEIETFDSARLAQYLRCMVHVFLPLAEQDFLALELLDQAILIADQSKEEKVGVKFPREEAEWLAATAFNHGLTRYAARDDMSACHAWLDRAIAMAQHVNDDGQFAASLQQRQQRLAASRLASPPQEA